MCETDSTRLHRLLQILDSGGNVNENLLTTLEMRVGYSMSVKNNANNDSCNAVIDQTVE